MRKTLAPVCIILLALSLGLCGCAKKAASVVGEVRLVTAGEEYAPYVTKTFEYVQYKGDEKGIAADYQRKQPNDVISELTPIKIADDVQIVIRNGKTKSSPSYVLYDEQFRQVYAYRGEFIKPARLGRHILCLDMVWGTEKSYSGYRYYFLIEK